MYKRLDGGQRMASSGQDREEELAELLREVRALRQTIGELKVDMGLRPKLPPNYEVLVRTRPALPPDYAVAVRQALPPTYAVAALQAFPPEYAVAVRPQLPFEVPSYEVLVRPVRPHAAEPPIVEP